MGPEPKDTPDAAQAPEATDRFIGAEGTEPPGDPKRSGDAKQRELDEALDAALACTFPASDPIGCFSECSRDR